MAAGCQGAGSMLMDGGMCLTMADICRQAGIQMEAAINFI